MITLSSFEHDPICSVDGCERVHEALGFCKKHYTLHRRHTMIQVRLAKNLRNRVWHAIKGHVKAGSAVRDLGCSLRYFMLYIENQFQAGMSWENYGEWHLDHIIPLVSFDLTNVGEFVEACNWLNYQPLWADQNLRKHANVALTLGRI